MPVKHPHADRDASPAAVTVGTTTYTVDSDGVIACPDSEADAVAERLAEVYGCDAAALRESDTSAESLADLTYDEVYERASAADVSGRSDMTKAELIAALEGED